MTVGRGQGEFAQGKKLLRERCPLKKKRGSKGATLGWGGELEGEMVGNSILEKGGKK